MRSTRGSLSHHPRGQYCLRHVYLGSHPRATSHLARPGLHFFGLQAWTKCRRSSQSPQQHPKDWSQSPRQPRSSGSGSSWQKRTAVSTSPQADTGHWLVQLTQRGGYISWPCFPLSPTHRDRGMDKMAWEDDWAHRQARRRKRRGWVAVSSWSGLLRFHLTRRCGERPHEIQAPDRRLPWAHANSATWSSANTGDRGNTGHGTRDGGRAGVMGS